jgi:hypothetical protein
MSDGRSFVSLHPSFRSTGRLALKQVTGRVYKVCLSFSIISSPNAKYNSFPPPYEPFFEPNEDWGGGPLSCPLQMVLFFFIE